MAPGMKFVLKWAQRVNNTTLSNIQKVKFARCKREHINSKHVSVLV